MFYPKNGASNENLVTSFQQESYPHKVQIAILYLNRM